MSAREKIIKKTLDKIATVSTGVFTKPSREGEIVYHKYRWAKNIQQFIADIQCYGGSADLFFDFAAGLIIRSEGLVLDAIEAKSIEEEDDLTKEIEMFKKYDHLRSKGIC